MDDVGLKKIYVGLEKALVDEMAIVLATSVGMRTWSGGWHGL